MARVTFAHALSSEAARLRRSPLVWLHAVLATVLGGLAGAYFAFSAWDSLMGTDAFFQLLGAGAPLLAGIACGLAADAEQRAGEGANLLGAVSYTHLDVYKRQPLRSIVKVTQTGDAVGDEQMMLELGKKMNPDLFYWDDVPEMLEFCTNNMATVPIHITFSELREKVIVYPEFEYYKYKTGKLRFDGNPGFNTLSGRVELFCNMYNNVGMDPLPYFKEPPESPESTPELFAEYPLVLTTGRRCWEYFLSLIHI